MNPIIFQPGDFVSVPFPHIERERTVRRPALVVALRDTGTIGVMLWTLMVTNAERPTWAGDVAVPIDSTTGLRVPSKVRTAKISTIEQATAILIGRLDQATWRTILAEIGINSADLAP